MSAVVRSDLYKLELKQILEEGPGGTSSAPDAAASSDDIALPPHTSANRHASPHRTRQEDTAEPTISGRTASHPQHKKKKAG